ncbi:hypothetical protein ACQ4PT_058679 [Festuca glaucescens]
MVARAASTLAGEASTMGAVVINLAVDVLVMPRADAWGKGPAEEGKASTVAVDTKVLDNLVLGATMFKGNQVGQPEMGITQIPEMKIGGDRGTTTTISIAIIEQDMGITSSDGLVRIMGEEGVLFSQVHHVSSACHLLQAPKPTAILHGYANEALMFFEMPCGAFKSKVENPKLAKVSVEGEVMTIPEIIEHMKRIVPYEKFHWEVFHYKDNIYRVKQPRKQEVQRLKNFGSYVCPQKDTILFFDLWSSVEEPLYMLPEVWVRVDGVPSDMRSDYLSLWGIGSLFGKTLDVDMPFTRKNKLLRIKIGCLDRNLIPADSDVFIRRGFYKLRFEVETGHIAQEVNMAEANNDKDGGGDPNNGLGDFDGHNDMEMDARGAEDEATSNKDGQDGNVAKNGVEGMQEHNEQVEEINIGTLKVPLSPIDSESVRFSSGLPRGRAPVAFSAGLSADSRQHSSRSCGAQPSGRPGELAVAAATNAASPAVQEQRCAAARAGAGPRTANGEQGTEPVGCAGDKRRSGTATQVGSSVAMQTESRTLVSSTLPQKILPTADTANPAVRGVQANHRAYDEPMMRYVVENLGGLGVHGNGMAFGVSPHSPNFNNSFFDSGLSMSPCFIHSESDVNDVAVSLEPDDKQMGDAMGSSLVQKKGEKIAIDLQSTMRDASSMKTAGELPIHFENSSNNAMHTRSISLVENDSVSHCPSIEEVIAFGGIPKPNIGVRSSTRLGGQPNVDMPQLEKAMKIAQLRDESSTSGQLTIPMHSIIYIPDSEIARRADRLGLETLVLSKVSTLCEDLIDDDDATLDLDDHLEHLKPVVKE